MWVERTPAEKRLYIRKLRLRRIVVSSLAFFGTAILVCFIYGGFSAAAKGSYFVPASDILQRIPIAITCGFFSGILCFLLFERKSVLICSKCESSKMDDGQTSCACGGIFQRIEDIKLISHEKMLR